MKAELWYLFFAYLFTWVLLFGYFVYLGRQQGRLQAELELLRRLLDRERGGSST